MGTNRLLACPSCGRHVRSAESTCPFCESLLPANFANACTPQPPGLRLSRAALYALGATSLTLASACSRAESSTSSTDAGVVAVDAGLDGGVSSKSKDGRAEADDDYDTDGASIAVYGGPPPNTTP